MEPMSCSGRNLPTRNGRRVVCHEGKVKVQDIDAACLPNSTYADDCNSCFCNENGIPGCTRKYCLSASELLPHPPKVPESGRCPHGQEYIDECNNDCTCSLNGEFYGCSRKACKPGERSMEPMTCSSGRNLPTRNGRRVFCHEGKVKVQDIGDTCLPGALFMNDCNSCFCSPNGDSGCTFKLCL